MKAHPFAFALALLLFLLGSPLADAAVNPTREQLLEHLNAAHWHPVTAERARQYSLAALLWLEQVEQDPELVNEEWQARIQQLTLQIRRQASLVPPGQVSPTDGAFAWLVDDLGSGSPQPFPLMELRPAGGLSSLVTGEANAARLVRRYAMVALKSPDIWSQVMEHLDQANIAEADRDLAIWVSALIGVWQELPPGMEEAGPEALDWLERAETHARQQATMVLQRLNADSALADNDAIMGLLLAQARFDWRQGQRLTAVWGALNGLALWLNHPEPNRWQPAWEEVLQVMAADADVLRLVDRRLPETLALLLAAIEHDGEADRAVMSARGHLADAYAQLALFIPDAQFYLDQPVREELQASLVQCYFDPRVVGPPPRRLFDSCLPEWRRILVEALVREELAGEADGPFARAFLKREASSVSWQRANYLDGHFDWLQGSPCESPAWVNPLEWSIVNHHVARWGLEHAGPGLRSVWLETLSDAIDLVEGSEQHRQQWLQCQLNQGGQRRDPIDRLLVDLERAYRELAARLAEAEQAFIVSHTRPSADIDLEAGAEQRTVYRPDNIMIGPCESMDACAARVQLPVSRALLGLFPNAYLLADQLDMGSLSLCYGDVRWVDRERRSARQRHSQVANYFGRLQFDLVGEFRRGDELEQVFVHRLTAQELQHYLFAEDSDNVLALDCPKDLIGQAVGSQLADQRLNLVPNRLTYFVATPTTPESELLANWDRGAEWRDWFITGGRVELLERASGEALEEEVSSRLTSLRQRRERVLAQRLTAPTVANAAPDDLAESLQEITERVILLRALLELHYPLLVRHDPVIRGLVHGEDGLVSVDSVRSLRDQSEAMRRLPDLGLERLERFRRYWHALPAPLRERGQPSPEMDYALEQLDRVRAQRSRAMPPLSADAGSLAAP